MEENNMAPFIVNNVLDTNKFRVMYGWKIGSKKGAFIAPIGVKIPKTGEPGYKSAMKSLYALLLGREVRVGDVYSAKGDTMFCRIYFNGKELSHYIKENSN